MKEHTQSEPAPGAPPGRNVDVERFVRHYRAMVRVRAFEEAALRGLKEGLVYGAIHPSIGQEAVAAGLCGNLRRSDVLLSTHRGHGETLVKGADAAAMMGELFGRASGVCKGKGGSMHIADFGVGMLGANGVVGANIELAAGAAHAVKLKGDDTVVACVFGDGAINRGPFLEGLNWAVVYRLPVLFVCQDNGFAATTRTAQFSAGPGPAARARALGLAAVEIDGNDVVAVDEAARDLVDAVRGGGGPRFMVARTYRLTGHTATDAAAYRSDQEVSEAWGRDPIARCAELLRGWQVPDEDLRHWQSLAQEEIQAAYETAREAPWPDATEAFADVQDVGAPRRRA